MTFAKFIPPPSNLSLDLDSEFPAHALRAEREWVPHRLITEYLDTHPHTRLNAVTLALILDRALKEAADDVRRDNIVYSRTLTADDQQFIIEHRAREIFVRNADVDDLAEIQYEVTSRAADNARHLTNQLDGIRQSIDRGAVAANVIDFATAHPFISAFLGKSILRRIKRL